MRIVILFLGMILCLSACSSTPIQQNLLNSMADLDKAYIPVVILTGMGKKIDSKVALERLQEKWGRFYSDYYPLEMKYGLNIVDKMWKSDLKLIGGDIASGESLVNVRNIFREMRRRHGMQYVLDDMLDFNDGIEAVKKISRQKKISERDLVLVKQRYDAACTVWDRILGAEKSFTVFQFEPIKIAAIKKKMKNLKKDLPILKSAIYSGEKEVVVLAAEKIEKEYMQIYRAFGDFTPILEKQVENRKKK